MQLAFYSIKLNNFKLKIRLYKSLAHSDILLKMHAEVCKKYKHANFKEYVRFIYHFIS